MDDAFERTLAEAWPRALATWSPFLLLGPPANQPEQDAIAQIDLHTRRVTLNGETIRAAGLLHCVEALLAHEIGHHVRWPGTLAVEARLRVIERALLPFKGYSVTNLFTDLLINAHLGERYREDYVLVYRWGTCTSTFERYWARDPVFAFVLAMYESLWRLEPGAILGERVALSLIERYPQARAEADLAVTHLFLLQPNIYTQFLWFLSFAVRYLPQQGPRSGSRCHASEPSPEDWAQALTPTAAEREAVRRALAERWFPEAMRERVTELDDLGVRVSVVPGAASMREMPEVMAAYYRKLAEQHLFRPPPVPGFGEAVVPTTLEEWDPEDGLHQIDWPATLAVRGPAWGAAAPLARTRIAEQEGAEVPLWQVRLELYLDVSGSMPDPCRFVNPMTLAAQILAIGAIRAGGRVRAALYSSDTVVYWQWTRSEGDLSRFLMHYIGSGTEFPFDRLASSLDECGSEQPIRVVLSDADFHANVASGGEYALGLLRRCAAGQRFILMLLGTTHDEVRYRECGVTVVQVGDMEDFPRVARELAWSLFEER